MSTTTRPSPKRLEAQAIAFSMLVTEPKAYIAEIKARCAAEGISRWTAERAIKTIEEQLPTARNRNGAGEYLRLPKPKRHECETPLLAFDDFDGHPYCFKCCRALPGPKVKPPDWRLVPLMNGQPHGRVIGGRVLG
jgi:hypothetical protein